MSANEPAPLRLSPGELTAFFGDMAALFKEKETEQDWDERDRMLQKLRGVARVPGIGRDPTFLEGLRTAADTLCKTLPTLRTTLALTACATVTTLTALGSPLEPHSEILLASLLKLTTSTKKLVATAAGTAIEALIRACPPGARHISLIEQRGTDKNPAGRVAACTFLRVVLEESLGSTWNSESLERSGALDIIERGIKRGLTDATPAAREQSRIAFGLLKQGWPERADKLLDSLDPTTRKGVARGFSSSGLPNLPSKIPAIAPVSSSPPVPANDERSSPASKNSSPADPASPITAPSPTLSNSTPVASRIAADLTSASPSVRARGLDAFLGLARSGPSESFLPAYLALLRQPDSSTRCVDELPALLEANIITALDVVSGLIDAPEHLRKPVVAKLGATAIEPLFAMLGDSDAQFALPWLLDLAGVPGIAEQLVPAAAPLALAGDRAAVAILAALREKDRWNYEKALRTFVGPEQVKLIQDLCDSDEDSNEEQDDEESEPAPAPATPSAVVLDSPDQPLPPRSTRGRKSEFFRPPATPSSDEGTPDFRTRISSLAAPRNATPSDAGTPGGLPPFPGSAIRSVRGSLAPLPTGATPSSAGTPFRIDQRKFRLSMSFRDEMMDPHGFEEGEGDVWQGTSLADELGAAGWDGFMEEEVPAGYDSGEQSRRQSVLPSKVSGRVSARHSLVGSDQGTPRARPAGSETMVTFAMETTPKPAGPISAKATPRSLVATPASPVSPQANREARPPLTPRTRDGPGGMVSIGSPSSESVLVPIGVETPRSTGRATSTPSTPATPSTPFMRAEIDAIKLGAGYKDMEGQKRRLFEMQTPLLDRAAHDNVLPILIDKMSNGIALESADWRRLIRLSEETKRRGAPVWGPWIDEVIDGVAAEWVAAGDRVRRNKARVTKEEADGATFPIYFFSQLAANQTELLRNSPRLSVMIGCFFDAFDEWGPNPRMQGLQAVAYSGLLTCLRKLNARTLCSACLEYLEVMPATRWREGPTVEQAHPLWACLKMLSLSLSRIHDSAARDPSRDPRELDGLLQQCRSWMVRGLYHGNSLVRMASTDVGIALWLFMGESLLNRGLAAPEGKTTAATESAKRNLIKCAVGLYETGKWRLGFASLGEGGNSAAFASSQ